MTTCRALLPVALALALSLSPRLNAGSYTFSDGNFTNYTWTSAKILDTTAGQTATFNAGETPAGAYNGGPYRTNAFHFSYNGTATNQGIIIGNYFTNIIYYPSISGAIEAITGFGIAGTSTFSGGGAPAFSLGLLLLQGGIYYTNQSVGLGGLDNQVKDQSSHLATAFTRVGSSGPLNPDFTTNGGPIQFGYFSAVSLSLGGAASPTGSIGADYFALSISNTPAVPQFTSQQPASGTNLMVSLSGLFVGESITWLVSTNVASLSAWSTNSTSSAVGTNSTFSVTNTVYPGVADWFLRAQVQ